MALSYFVTNDSIPAPGACPKIWTQISSAASSYHTCAVASGVRAYCWGDNQYGQVGNGSSDVSIHSTPIVVDTTNAGSALKGKAVSYISAGVDHTCAIGSDSKAYCWGRNNQGQLGIGGSTDANPHTLPLAVDTSGVLNGLTIKNISSGYEHTCVIASNNNTYCWGVNDYGQLGIGSVTAAKNNSTIGYWRLNIHVYISWL